jgi:hypothetical protein
MNAVLLRRKIMQYRGHDFQYESDNDALEPETAQEPTSGKEYRRKRSMQATRRNTSKEPKNRPGCGIGARRNHRWTW